MKVAYQQLRHPCIASVILASLSDCGAQLNTTLRRLELNGNAIDRSGTAAIAEALKGNSALESLHIRSASRACGVHVPQPPNLRLTQRTLIFSDNYLGEAGAKLLADALSGNTTITELSLKGNELGDVGIKAICEALAERSCGIKSLDLGNNRYLQHWHLLRLDSQFSPCSSCCSLTADGTEALAKLLKRTKIQDLNLYMNDIGDKGMQQASPWGTSQACASRLCALLIATPVCL